MEKKANTITLFLEDGSPEGIISAEVDQWTGKVLSFRSGMLPDVFNLEKLNKAGVYLFVGPDEDNPLHSVVYVGKSDNLEKRLKGHELLANDDRFHRIFIYFAKDENLSSGHITHIEKYLIQRLRSLKTAQIKNGNDGVAVNLSRPEKSQVENIIEKLELVLPILGFTFLTDSTSNRNSQAVRKAEFELVAHDGRVKASAYEYEGQIVVKKGSLIRHPSEATSSLRKNTLIYIDSLIAESQIGEVVDRKDVLAFQNDVAFPSPSAASDVICGTSTNGRNLWRVQGTQLTYGEWKKMELDKATTK